MSCYVVTSPRLCSLQSYVATYKTRDWEHQFIYKTSSRTSITTTTFLQQLHLVHSRTFISSHTYRALLTGSPIRWTIYAHHTSSGGTLALPLLGLLVNVLLLQPVSDSRSHIGASSHVRCETQRNIRSVIMLFTQIAGHIRTRREGSRVPTNGVSIWCFTVSIGEEGR